MSSSPFPWSIRKIYSLVINECSYNRTIFVVDQVFLLFRSKSHPHRVQPSLSSRQSAATRDLLVGFTEGLSGLMVDLSHRFEMTAFFSSPCFLAPWILWRLSWAKPRDLLQTQSRLPAMLWPTIRLLNSDN